ncbi:MAG: iron chelate uptake ABC transporter family permease subunit [Veillonella caviae]|nr:iron chelate uptake ABC transporter family permease subunit [Veillonella caviae]
MLADILARVVNPPFETPLGAITTIVGAPFFIYLANRKGGK